MSWRVVVLAAGKGTRMRSDLAKVLHRIDGETLLGRVLETVSQLPIEEIVVVVGHQAASVRDLHQRFRVHFVTQEPQLGTGHAVQQAVPHLEGHDGETLILYGDVPLLRRSTLLELMEEHLRVGNAATVLTARVPDPRGYGRILRGKGDILDAIVEDRDLHDSQRSIDEINSGIYAYRTELLIAALQSLGSDNDQKEYYLTDTIADLAAGGFRVGTYRLADPVEISGINTVEQLAEAEDVLLEWRKSGRTDCPVCLLVRSEGAGPESVLCRRENAILAIDSAPYNSGQLIVYPSRHLTHHSRLLDPEREEVWNLARLAAEVVMELYNPEGMNFGYLSGEPGEHLGLRVIPRWGGDTNFMPILADQTLLPEALSQTCQRLRDALRARGIDP